MPDRSGNGCIRLFWFQYDWDYFKGVYCKREAKKMIPDYQIIMLPLLKLLDDQQEHSLQDSIDNSQNQQ